MEVGSCGVLDMSQVYHKTLFGPMFYSWWNCPLRVSSEIVLWIYDSFNSKSEIVNDLKECYSLGR